MLLNLLLCILAATLALMTLVAMLVAFPLPWNHSLYSSLTGFISLAQPFVAAAFHFALAAWFFRSRKPLQGDA